MNLEELFIEGIEKLIQRKILDVVKSDEENREEIKKELVEVLKQMNR